MGCIQSGMDRWDVYSRVWIGGTNTFGDGSVGRIQSGMDTADVPQTWRRGTFLGRGAGDVPRTWRRGRSAPGPRLRLACTLQTSAYSRRRGFLLDLARCKCQQRFDRGAARGSVPPNSRRRLRHGISHGIGATWGGAVDPAESVGHGDDGGGGGGGDETPITVNIMQYTEGRIVSKDPWIIVITAETDAEP